MAVARSSAPTHRRRTASGVLLGLLMALALACSPAAASPETDTPAWADGQFITYGGTYSSVFGDFPGGVTLFCDDEGCGVLVAGDIVLRPLTTTGDGEFSGDVPARGDPCGEERFYTAGTVALTASATDIELTWDVDNTRFECESGTATAVDSTFAGTFDTGDVCVLAGESCAAVTDVAPSGDVPASDGTPGGAVDADSAPDLGLVAERGSALNTGSPLAPSVLWQLPTLQQAPITPSQLVLAALVTIILVLLVSFPTSLLNSAIDAAPERFAALRERVRQAIGRPPAAPVVPDETSDRPFSRRWTFAAVGVLAAAIVSCFVDPEFGLNPGSGRVLLGIVMGFVIDVVIGWSVAVAVCKKLDRSATTRYHFSPWSLLIVALAVLFTRITGFEPGIVFGLVAGVAVGLAASRVVRGQVALTLAAYALAVGIIGWLLYSAIGPALAAEPTFAGALLIDTLSSLAMGGVAAAPLVLLPVRGMSGYEVFAWNRWIWAGCYALALFLFFFVLMPMPYSWSEVSLSLGAWIVMYVAYSAVALSLWLVIKRPWVKSEPKVDGADAQPSVDAEPPVDASSTRE